MIQKWLHVGGRFSKRDAEIYRTWARDCPSECIIVEVGVARGRSLSCLMSELDIQGKDRVLVYGVDCWNWPELFPVAAANLAPWGRRTRLIHCESVIASRLFQAGGVWGVFIDANHDYDAFKEDIEVWSPKATHRLGGHDYSATFPGVVRAVDEYASVPVIRGDTWDVDLRRADGSRRSGGGLECSQAE